MKIGMQLEIIHYHDHYCLSFDLEIFFHLTPKQSIDQNGNLELSNVGGLIGVCREITFKMCDGSPTT